jgi:hypothetical protein
MLALNATAQEGAMRTRIWTAACAALAFGMTAGLAAQTSSSATAQQQSESTSAKKVMVTGCVERATPTPTGTTGTTESRGAAKSEFVLMHATMSPGSASGSTSSTTSGATSPGAAGTTGSTSALTSEKQYELDATSAQLAAHVGHKVEITGTIEEPGVSATARTNPPSASASASTSTANQERLKVDSVRMISTTCS